MARKALKIYYPAPSSKSVLTSALGNSGWAYDTTEKAVTLEANSGAALRKHSYLNYQGRHWRVSKVIQLLSSRAGAQTYVRVIPSLQTKWM